MDSLTSAQLSEWEAYDRIDPVGEWRGDYRMAYLASLVVNLSIQIHGKKGSKLTTPADFLPVWDEGGKVKKNQSVEEMKQILLGIASAQNNQVKKGLKNEHRNINSDIRGGRQRAVPGSKSNGGI